MWSTQPFRDRFGDVLRHVLFAAPASHPVVLAADDPHPNLAPDAAAGPDAHLEAVAIPLATPSALKQAHTLDAGSVSAAIDHVEQDIEQDISHVETTAKQHPALTIAQFVGATALIVCLCCVGADRRGSRKRAPAAKTEQTNLLPDDSARPK